MKQFLSLLLSAAFTLAPCAAIGEENASLGRELIPIADSLPRRPTLYLCDLR